MAIPTRLVVLLHSRKSAIAGRDGRTANAPASVANVAMRCAARHPVAMVDRLFMPGGCNFRIVSRSVNEDRAEIVDIGGGRAGRQQVAKAREKPRGVVVGKKRGRIEALGVRARKRGGVDQRAGRIVRASAA